MFEGAGTSGERERRVRQDLRREWGRRLRAAGRLPRGARAAVAETLGVSVRTLLNWESSAEPGHEPAPVGRPRVHGESAREWAMTLVACERRKVCRRAGWRAIVRSLEGRGKSVPLRLVWESLRVLKLASRWLERLRIEAERESVEVLERDAVWAEDGMQLGRVAGEPVMGEAVRDRATLGTVTEALSGTATQEEAKAHLDRAEAERGTLPLVLQTDLGSAYTGEDFERYLRERQVVHLRSRPGTPTDNPAAERAVGELKAASGLASDLALASVEEARVRLAAAREQLDGRLPRTSRGGLTARELDRVLPGWYPRVSRAEFYEAACTAIAEAVEGAGTVEEARVAEREAILATLERFGLVRRTKGGKPLAAPDRRRAGPGSGTTRQDASGSTIGGVGGPVSTPPLRGADAADVPAHAEPCVHREPDTGPTEHTSGLVRPLEGAGTAIASWVMA